MDHPGHGVRGPAHLLLHQDLLEGGEPLPAELLRHVDGLEAQLSGAAFGLLPDAGRELALVQLGVLLVGDELVDQGSGPRLDIAVLVGHRIGHRWGSQKFD